MQNFLSPDQTVSCALGPHGLFSRCSESYI